MEMDTTQPMDTWNEIEALQNETKALLEAIRGKPKDKNKGKAQKTAASIAKPKKKSKQQQQPQTDTVQSLDLTKTRNLFHESNRVTVEVLDDASPDVTPRNDIDDAKKEFLEKKKEKFNELTTLEKSYRKTVFTEERSRVLSKKDTFIGGPGVTAEDVEKERKRLAYLEDTAKRKQRNYYQEVESRKEYLKQDRVVIKIQAAFRGHIGRQRYYLTKKINDIQLSEDKAGDWIEVSDPVSGDTWYYNKKTNVSQWKIPDEIALKQKKKLKKKLNLTTTTSSPSKLKLKELKSGALAVSTSLPSLKALELSKKSIPFDDAVDEQERTKSLKKTLSFARSDVDSVEEKQARQDVDHILGIDNYAPPDTLLAPDGRFKPQLRTTVLDALLDTRFDSVSTVIADKRWLEIDADPFVKSKSFKNKTRQLAKLVEEGAAEEKVDPSRPSMVSVMTINKKKSKKSLQLEAVDYGTDYNEDMRSPTLNQAKDLTFKEIEHPGFEGPHDATQMCFGCWSAGSKRKCELHSSDMPIKASQTMLLCRNWDLDVMRRRYRAEEIQEIYMAKGTSLRFDVKFHKFYTVIEKKHPVYRGLSVFVEKFNNRMVLYEKIKRWILSLPDHIRTKKVDVNVARMMSVNRSMLQICKVRNYSKVNSNKLPIAPTTGYSWPERTGTEQYLFRHRDLASAEEVDLINVYPLPVPEQLYKPRVYRLGVPTSIPMPQASYSQDANLQTLPQNEFIDEHHPLAWIERMCSAIARDSLNSAKLQVNAITPVTQTNLVERTKKPPPTTIKFAITGQKPTPGFLAVGGFAKELLINQLVSTQVSAQYGNFMVMEKSVVSPGVSKEETIAFVSIVMQPIIQHYFIRALEHPLNYRRAPTITLNSHVKPTDLHFYGKNRAEQTGEEESHGFRTTTWAPMLLTYMETDPQVFIPGEGVVSLNAPKSNASYTTHADASYPFCEPSTRDNSTLDFYHLLLTGVVSISKPQIFSALTVQEPGMFYMDCKANLPMGHLVVSVYRSWAFAQKETIQEFKTDDGVSYWYHRKTGQTFWERPLFKEEEFSPLQGGTILDTDHPEEPSVIHKGEEGATRRYLQGEFRKQMLTHIETNTEAMKRRQNAATTIKTAKHKGQIPIPDAVLSIANHPQTSGDLGSRFDFSNGGNPSVEMHGDDSFYTQKPPSVDQNQQQFVPFTASQEFGESIDLEEMNPRPRGYVTQQDQNAHTPASVTGQNQSSGVHPMYFINDMQQSSQQHYGTQPYSIGHGNHSAQQSQFGQPMQPQFPGIDANMMATLSYTLSNMFNNMMHMDKASPEDMIQLGLGMGMALMQTNAVSGIVDNQMYPPDVSSAGDYFPGNDLHVDLEEANMQEGHIPTIAESTSAALSIISEGSEEKPPPRVSMASPVSMRGNGQQEPIGKVYPTTIFSSDKVLDQSEAEMQKETVGNRINQPLSSIDRVRFLKVAEKPSETPDEQPVKALTDELPINAEDGAKEAFQLLAYPELSSRPKDGPPIPHHRYPPAGEGTSFVNEDQAESQAFVPDSEIPLRRIVMPLPAGFYESIEAKHLAKQEVDYLPQVPNLPQSRTIGRVKPRSAAADWLMIKFDPWSAGKNPLGTEFVPSLMAKAETLFEVGGGKALDEYDQLRSTAVAGAYVDVADDEGLAAQRAEVSKAQVMAEDFKKICSLCRHSKFSDAEQLINQPDWSVPIDYQDDQGNSLLHVVAQNGNKRMVKLCLRRGASLNLQNIAGQTPLHFAFGFGYVDVGNYLVSKGADDSVRNKDGLTCYEGLGAKELEML